MIISSSLFFLTVDIEVAIAITGLNMLETTEIIHIVSKKQFL